MNAQSDMDVFRQPFQLRNGVPILGGRSRYDETRHAGGLRFGKHGRQRVGKFRVGKMTVGVGESHVKWRFTADLIVAILVAPYPHSSHGIRQGSSAQWRFRDCICHR